MIIRNTSKYSTEEVTALIRLGAGDLNVSRVCVNVRNSKGAYAGRAYGQIPCVSNAPKSCQYLVVLRIGAESSFPVSNMTDSVRWVRVKPGEVYDVSEVRSCGNGTEHWLERMVVRSHPYGGNGSPLIEMKDWREGLVSLAAHEFRHINLFREKLVRSEIACERFSAERLAAYRETLFGYVVCES